MYDAYNRLTLTTNLLKAAADADAAHHPSTTLHVGPTDHCEAEGQPQGGDVGDVLLLLLLLLLVAWGHQKILWVCLLACLLPACLSLTRNLLVCSCCSTDDRSCSMTALADMRAWTTNTRVNSSSSST